ncbi:MAG: lipoyl synthase [Candidatus Thermoplasmatota archaeon]
MTRRRHPDWLKVQKGGSEKFKEIKKLLHSAKLHTICEEANCPNRFECFDNGTAVFLIMGDVCSRNCRYCNVKHGQPKSLNWDEPQDVAESVKKLGLNYVVVTSVTRDDLDDGGAKFFSKTTEEIRKMNSDCKVELLIPDFQGDKDALKTVVGSKPVVVNHNIEVVKNLFPSIRPQGNYKISLKVLKNIKKIDPRVKSKSGFMVGLGETYDQIIETMKDLRNSDVDFLTIGQYLQPSRNHASIEKYYTPEEFHEFKKIAVDIGFEHVESGPLVRSSYHAERAIK